MRNPPPHMAVREGKIVILNVNVTILQLMEKTPPLVLVHDVVGLANANQASVGCLIIRI
jgi:hypothetical protein